MSRVAVIGGGAAGMFAAVFAAKSGHEVTLYEKNEKLGKKLFITGKGRCNVTNASEIDVVFDNIVTNRKFLYSSIYGFDNQMVIDFFETNGLALKVERGNRVFPASDHSSDVIRVLSDRLHELNVTVCLHTQVDEILTKDGRVSGIRIRHQKIAYDAVILCTGGVSYASTGSDGQGLSMAEKLGHTVTELLPSLVPLVVEQTDAQEMMGLSLRNVQVRILRQNKVIYEGFGEMLFTHFGVSGPLILSASSYVGKYLQSETLTLAIDLKPALDEEQLDARILREFEQNSNRSFKNVLTSLLPSKMIPVMIKRSQIPEEKKANAITKQERKKLVQLLKNYELTLCATRDFKEAIITKGGIETKQIDPSTMESKLVPGLYFAGEMIDVDALTGGYNLQIAWSTAHQAGISIQ
jgi:hypothetical protein